MRWRSISPSIRVLLLSMALAVLPRAASAEITAEASFNSSGGYGRLVFLFSETTDADVRMSNGILVISFRKPIDVAVDRVATNNEYISAARRDPDGKGLRMALSRKVRINSMMAGERLFVDLLPEDWSQPLPSLPQEVIEDLARRAREAEKRAAQNQAINRQRPPDASRVRVSRQPTFTRYIFELPEFITVNADRGKDKIKLVFDRSIQFDLADAKVMQPPMVGSIEAKTGENTTAVDITFNGKVDVRSFREDNNFVVDIVTSDGAPQQSSLPPLVPAAESSPLMRSDEPAGPVPGRPKSDAPRPAAPAPRPSSEAAPAVTPPEKIAEKKLEQPADKPSDMLAAAVPVLPPVTVETPKELVKAPELSPQAAGASLRGEGGEAGAQAVTMRRQGDGTSMLFPFSAPTPAAAFMRADTLWLVFDSVQKIELPTNKNEIIRDTAVVRSDDLQLVRIRLERPRLVSFAPEDNNWTVNIGDSVVNPAQPVGVMRNVVNELRPSANIPFDDPRNLHRILDPDVGDTLIVVTAIGPTRGVPKTQDFVDFRALATIQGIVIQPIADDVNVELSPDRVMIGRPGGLTLTSSSPTGRRGGVLRPMMFDSQQWGFDRQAKFLPRQVSLIDAASRAVEGKRTQSRLELARFYFARDMYSEAKGVLDVALADDRPSSDDTIGLVMRGVAQIMMGRPEDGLKDIGNPIVGVQNDAQLWRALAAAKLGKWAEARDGFRKTEVAIGMLPLELQREIYKEAVHASIEVGDFAGAAGQMNEFETLNVPAEMRPALAVLSGRIHEGLGRNQDALAAYREAAQSGDRASAAAGRLRELALRYRTGDLARTDVISDLETLTSIWRGDETEVESLQMLARLYTEEGRYRDAFNMMRTAMRVQPDSERTHSIQDDAAATFTALFLGNKGDQMPAIEALSLFYDFRELTPIGRKGDEMIRRLADRLVSVDLLDQAAELLQHQVDHRLQGAARAQVATRLAVIYLMNRKPDRALGVLKATRSSELSNEIRNQRLLIEARALSDIGRHSLALEVIEHVDTPDASRTRSDLLWSAKRFRESAEQIELLYADRWRDWTEFNELERRDLLRAAMGYNLADDKIGLERFKEKFAPAMMQSPDRRAFTVVTAPLASAPEEFNAIARNIAAVDTLGQFLREIRSGQEPAGGAPQSSLRSNPQTRMSQPDFSPTGSIKRTVKSRGAASAKRAL
jgi:tetratricopeptide (TPR) repeat protein